jgi:hypothetical protein
MSVVKGPGNNYLPLPRKRRQTASRDYHDRPRRISDACTVPLIAGGRWSENQGNCVAKDDAAFKCPNRVRNAPNGLGCRPTKVRTSKWAGSCQLLPSRRLDSSPDTASRKHQTHAQHPWSRGYFNPICWSCVWPDFLKYAPATA